MKKTGCKAAILILLAVLVLSTQAFAVRGGRGRRRDAAYGPTTPGRPYMEKGLCCPYCQRPYTIGQGFQGRGMGRGGRGFQGKGLGPCGQGFGRKGMMTQRKPMMGKWGQGLRPGGGGGRRGQGFQGRGMGRPGQGFRGRGMGRRSAGGPPEGIKRPGRGGPSEDEDVNQPGPPMPRRGMGRRGQGFQGMGRGPGFRGMDQKLEPGE